MNATEERCYVNAFAEILIRLQGMTETIQDAPAPDFATPENFEAMCNLRYYLEMAQGELKNL